MSTLTSRRSAPEGPYDRDHTADPTASFTLDDTGSDSVRRTVNHDTRHFTPRALAVGLFIGILNCICNTYFILQAGWGSGMSMSSSLAGFALFRLASPFLSSPFTATENVLVQTVASTTGMINLSCGFAGVMPALDFLLKPGEGAPADLNLGRLVLWCLGTCLVGSVFSTFLRKQLILREKLRFPSGTATACLISVLHKTGYNELRRDSDIGVAVGDETEVLIRPTYEDGDDSVADERLALAPHIDDFNDDSGGNYVRYLVTALIMSTAFSLVSYFVPGIRQLPIFGKYMASHWLWTLDPSPAYIGHGAIMGPSTSLHVLFGAVIAWGVLSPLAAHRGWADGPIDDFERGPKGWVIWIALAVLLADSMLNLCWLLIRLIVPIVRGTARFAESSWRNGLNLQRIRHQYIILQEQGPPSRKPSQQRQTTLDDPYVSQEPFISNRVMSVLFGLALLFCIGCVHATFGSYLKFWSIILAILLSMLSSVMAARSIGETDFSPNSGIAKLAQLVFGVVTPASSPNAIVINLLAGSISESGAQQAGDLMQDFKTAHLLGASAKAQFHGHIIGSVFGAIISPFFYRLYASLYTIPSKLFQIPAAYLWLFTARLLTGRGLPTMVPQLGASFGLVFLLVTALRMYVSRHPSAQAQKWTSFVPSGIAVAIGMYTTPSFSLPRAIGGLLNWWYVRRNPSGRTTVIVIASGLILGEGVMSIVNLFMTSLGVPHF